jgi:hypothetical protein
MLKSTILSILLIVVEVNMNSQKNEYRYSSFRLGITHHFWTPQPENPIDNYILGSDNQLYQLHSEKSVLYNYSLSFGADLLYHFDNINDKTGIVTGLGFQIKKISFEYSADNLDYMLYDRYKSFELEMPLIFKFGDDIYNKMRYLYAGAKFYYILGAKNKNNYQSKPEFRLNRIELNPLNVSILAGFNYHILNLGIEYQINSIFNKSYQNSYGNFIYSTQKGNYIFLKTAINFCPRYYEGRHVPFIPRHIDFR